MLHWLITDVYLQGVKPFFLAGKAQKRRVDVGESTAAEVM
jgi:hypothetical protein